MSHFFYFKFKTFMIYSAKVNWHRTSHLRVSSNLHTDVISPSSATPPPIFMFLFILMGAMRVMPLAQCAALLMAGQFGNYPAIILTSS